MRENVNWLFILIIITLSFVVVELLNQSALTQRMCVCVASGFSLESKECVNVLSW